MDKVNKSEKTRKNNPGVENDNRAEKDIQNENKNPENENPIEKEEKESMENDGNSNNSEAAKAYDQQAEALRQKLEEKEKQCEEYFSRLQRMAAEFDNYKKRTVKEREGLVADAMADVVAAILPVLDNFERALQVKGSSEEFNSLKEGIAMVFKQFNDILAGLGVEEIKSLGESFDPNVHNAVMHVEDETAGENIVVEVFQKGYRMKDKVIRHSMVKVAN